MALANWRGSLLHAEVADVRQGLPSHYCLGYILLQLHSQKVPEPLEDTYGDGDEDEDDNEESQLPRGRTLSQSEFPHWA